MHQDYKYFETTYLHECCQQPSQGTPRTPPVVVGRIGDDHDCSGGDSDGYWFEWDQTREGLYIRLYRIVVFGVRRSKTGKEIAYIIMRGKISLLV